MGASGGVTLDLKKVLQNLQDAGHAPEYAIQGGEAAR
jgi:hypothetical protein